MSEQMRAPLIFSVGIAVASAASAWSQKPVDAETIKQYEGVYSSDCSNAAGPRLHVGADALTVEQGAKRMTGRNLQSFYSFFGQSPPPNYQVALLSDVSEGVSLMFIVYRDKSGQYITLDGDPRVTGALGKTMLTRTYRQCGSSRKEAASAPVAPPPQPSNDIELAAT